eukprot:TRINITY_DN197_c0_g1_i2.p1 TRINITY_DN197_c0_g1~~TRINITY_DN197_c0_g1_i2.p1  ORF type:complete len:136 (-),score=27.54 TRINITY_DN197_c0_g1_i2:159-566(-)
MALLKYSSLLKPILFTTLFASLFVVSLSSSNSVEQTTQDYINQNSVMVFSKSYCPFCRKAKDLLTSKGVDFKVVELNEDPLGSDIQNYLKIFTGQSTVPNIFINKTHVGGLDSIKKLDSEGKLDKMLKAIRKTEL